MFRTGDERKRREKSVGIGKSSHKGAVRRDRSLQVRRYFDRLNHEFGAQKRREERGVSSSYDTASESGLDPLPDYDEDEAGVGSIPGGSLVGECPPALC